MLSPLGVVIECCEVKGTNGVLYVECMMPHHYTHALLVRRNSNSVKIEIGDFACWDSVEGNFYWTPINVRNVYHQYKTEYGSAYRFCPPKYGEKRYKKGKDYDIKIKLVKSMNVCIERKENNYRRN